VTKFEQLERQLIEHEGLRLKPYYDTADPPRLTIGVGRNLDNVGLRSEAEANYLLRNDIEAIWRELMRRWPTVATLDDVRRDVILDMAFNLGVASLMRFRKTLAYVEDGKFEAASVEMLRSRWKDQVGDRATRLSKMMASGERVPKCVFGY